MNIDIRFNTDYPANSQFEWRVLVDGEEHLVNTVRCEVPTFSSTTFIAGRGMKWHMSAIANKVIFQDHPNNIKHAQII
jgi:hypothetical protein